MVLPNFFVVGAQKSGTTALHHYLVDHPEIFLPSQKETKFFVDDGQYSQGVKYYSEKYFAESKNEKVVGEIDPDYMYFNVGVERIFQHIPNSKLIFIFRNPVDRAFSHYVMTYRRGLELNTFEEAIRIEAERIEQGYEQDFHFSYVRRGFYFDQVNRFLEKWDKSQMLFLLAEDLNNNPVETVRKCFEFLGVAPDFVPGQISKRFHEATVPKNLALTVLFRNEQAYPIARRFLRLFVPKLAWRDWLRARLIAWNKKPSDLKLLDETRRQLAEHFRPENEKLARLIRRDLSHWNC
ncbi:sulfotransferase family protein [Sulfurirhabdus autotrophica]|uniref:Sulfotransferase domain-containing protein n=1 Tax=Sulfurirhabdus autotrophica TaxID=1706046 RepID=A0A4R3XUR0_9PROT|nr:sulfotransferase [Sulfurirhabdus autotrophica]TCV83435.1 sulfotransferase domain-containing protein [Sulfurirhabdus autotrophica]